jgi:lipid II isoglutaminyl synthase (glutamine-hydrolysing)
MHPDFLAAALKRLPDGVIVISGTNGKTTTTKLVADTFEALGERVMTNRTGSNMTRGLISTIVSRSNFFGKLPYDAAVLEVDEAYAAVLAKKVPIRAALILNVMRDQLDRFGEIDTTAAYLSELSVAVLRAARP